MPQNRIEHLDPSTARLRARACTVRVGPDGAVHVQIGADAYAIHSSFSHPGKRIGWNHLSPKVRQSEPRWRPRVKQADRNTIELRAEGRHYSVRRIIRIEKHRIKIEDKITNRRKSPVGVLVRHRLLTPTAMDTCLLGGLPRPGVAGMADNPTAFVSLPESTVGLLAEDSVFRLKLAARSYKKRVTLSVDHFALGPGKSHTFEWAVYPMRGKRDYFDFINRVRRDWNTNFTVQGPFCYLDVTSPKFAPLLKDPAALKAYFRRNRARIVCLLPWLDYDNSNRLTGALCPRPEYRTLMRAAMSAIRKAAPGTLFIGAMEGDLVSPPEDCMRALYELQPRNRRAQGYYRFTRKQMDYLNRHDFRWKDCLLTRPDGRYTLELFQRYGRPLIAPAVYAARGNAQRRYWLEQARFMIEDVGLDGVYTDQFSLVFGEQFKPKEVFTHFLRFSHHAWDGVTVDIDPKTGQIRRKYTDGSLAGIGARADLIDYVLSHGKVMVTNMHSAVQEIQSRPIFRFGEAQIGCDPLAVRRGKEPPLRPLACRGQLGSPIAIGYAWGPRRTFSKAILKTVIAYLRHGLLCYHYGLGIPDSGAESHGFEPVNHMFPFTPVGLHKGWLEGKERIITCLSGTFPWRHTKPPATHLFDIRGHALPHRFARKRSGRAWEVEIKLEDWEQIAILEIEP